MSAKTTMALRLTQINRSQASFVDASIIDNLLPDSTLGVQCFGASPNALTSIVPNQSVAIAALDNPEECLAEIWQSDDNVTSGRSDDITFTKTEKLLFGVISIDEQSLADHPSGSSLLGAAELAYRQIFSLLEGEGYPHLWRVWNYIPRIHDLDAGLERYRQFNIGRHQAFQAFQRPVNSSPAACALGVVNGALSIAFIASRDPAARIENSRQVSAFEYPTQYGPRSPTFSRAAIADLGDGKALFISGTASIVGHETLHHGDVVAQTKESLANIAVLVEQANLYLGRQTFTLSDLLFRVYIRHNKHYQAVQTALHERLGNKINARYFQADVCRSDLLVEIEAVAILSTLSST